MKRRISCPCVFGMVLCILAACSERAPAPPAEERGKIVAQTAPQPSAPTASRPAPVRPTPISGRPAPIRPTPVAARKPSTAPLELRIALDKQETMDVYNAFMDDPAAFLGGFKLTPYLDATGQTAGLTIHPGGDTFLTETLALAEGDVIQHINNEPVQNATRLAELFEKGQRRGVWRVALLREGEPLIMLYYVQEDLAQEEEAP